MELKENHSYFEEEDGDDGEEEEKEKEDEEDDDDEEENEEEEWHNFYRIVLLSSCEQRHTFLLWRLVSFCVWDGGGRCNGIGSKHLRQCIWNN